LAEAANAESLRQNDAAKAKRRELASQIQFLRNTLATIPSANTWSQADSIMRGSTGWDDFDFDAFRKLASEVSDVAATCAATIETKNAMDSRTSDLG
jgi:hypothetical protein